MVERKCLSCGTWNKDEDFCTSCGAAISPKEIERIEDAKREALRKNQPKDKLDVLLEKAKHSKYWFVRTAYYILYSVAFIVFAIGSFVTYLVAWSPG